MRAAFAKVFPLCLLLAAAPPRAAADPVLDWDALMLDAIRADNTGPTVSTRNLAILHVALYDAVNSILRTHQPYMFLVDPPANADPAAAVIGAGYEVMKALYPTFRARSDQLYQAGVASLPPGPATGQSLGFGAQVALQTLASRQNDGANTDVPYIPSNAPGQWRRTPPFFRPPLTPQWRYVKLFCLPEKEPFVPPPPPPMDSPEYAAAFNEVKAIGGVGSALRTPYQSETAVFWSDFSYTAMPPGHWHEIAAGIARDRGTSLADNARLFALLSLAHADAGIICWEAKYRYNFWRPVTAIQRADEDGNPATEADPAWNHYLASPPFPDHTSGHSTFSAAAAEVLAQFYGTDRMTFTAMSDSLPGVVRTYHSFSECADEVGMSRIYGGIHYDFSNRDGKSSGRKVGQFIMANYLLPNDALPRLQWERFLAPAWQLRLHGRIGQPLVLEATGDFATWDGILTSLAKPGGVAWAVPAAELECLFFRLRQGQP